MLIVHHVTTGEGNSEDAVIILQQQQGEGWAEVIFLLDHNASVLYQVLVSVNSGRQVGPMETTPKSRKKGQPREMNLTAQCLICNGPAAAHQVSLCFLFEEDLYA